VNVLALDGALGTFSAAVARGDSIAAAQSESGNVALELGLAVVESVLEAARLGAPQIDRLAVGVGPGGFTGLRIAIAYAKSLAAAWERPLVPISSFDALEFGRPFERVLTVVVGRPGVISARYRSLAEVRRASGRIPEVLDALFPSSAPPREEGVMAVVGAAKDVLDALAERAIIVRSLNPVVTPAAAAVALSASSQAAAKSVHEVRADYGELPAVKLPRF
jgi:tRNA threonylcarbamoyladenosine biosynthesis protein TsaB